MTGGCLLEMYGVSIGYGTSLTKEPINFATRPGELIGLAGPNGAGKSTLLKTMLGIIPPVQGTVVRQAGIRLGYVPQRSRIDPLYPQTAAEVVGQGGLGGGIGFGFRPAGRDAAETALARLDILSLRHKRYRDLSGGQQQRVLIARALVRNPALLVLDEPTEGLDLPSEKQILDFILSLNQKQEMTVILVAHKLSIVANCARRVVLINKDTGLFSAGDASEILTDETLSALYGHPMVAERKEGRLVSIRAGEIDNEAAG